MERKRLLVNSRRRKTSGTNSKSSSAETIEVCQRPLRQTKRNIKEKSSSTAIDLSLQNDSVEKQSPQMLDTGVLTKRPRITRTDFVSNRLRDFIFTSENNTTKNPTSSSQIPEKVSNNPRGTLISSNSPSRLQTEVTKAQSSTMLITSSDKNKNANNSRKRIAPTKDASTSICSNLENTTTKRTRSSGRLENATSLKTTSTTTRADISESVNNGSGNSKSVYNARVSSNSTVPLNIPKVLAYSKTKKRFVSPVDIALKVREKVASSGHSGWLCNRNGSNVLESRMQFDRYNRDTRGDSDSGKSGNPFDYSLATNNNKECNTNEFDPNGVKTVPMNSLPTGKNILQAMAAAANSVMVVNNGIKIPHPQPSSSPLTKSVTTSQVPNTLQEDVNNEDKSEQNQLLDNNNTNNNGCKENNISRKMLQSISDFMSAVIAHVAVESSDDEGESEARAISVDSEVHSASEKIKRMIKTPKRKSNKSRGSPTLKNMRRKVSSLYEEGSESDSLSRQIESQPHTPASTLPLLSPTESIRESSHGCSGNSVLPSDNFSIVASASTSRANSSSGERSDVDDPDSDVISDSPILYSPMDGEHSGSSIGCNSHGNNGTMSHSALLKRGGFVDEMLTLRETVIDLKTKLNDQKAMTSTLLAQEEAVKDKIRKLENFIDAFKQAFPEIPIPRKLFPPPLPAHIFTHHHIVTSY